VAPPLSFDPRSFKYPTSTSCRGETFVSPKIKLPRGQLPPLGPVEQPRGSQFDTFHTPTRSLFSYSITTYWVEARKTDDAGIDISATVSLAASLTESGATSGRVLGRVRTNRCVYIPFQRF
jgi:hypothetical protein